MRYYRVSETLEIFLGNSEGEAIKKAFGNLVREADGHWLIGDNEITAEIVLFDELRWFNVMAGDKLMGTVKAPTADHALKTFASGYPDIDNHFNDTMSMNPH